MNTSCLGGAVWGHCDLLVHCELVEPGRELSLGLWTQLAAVELHRHGLLSVLCNRILQSDFDGQYLQHVQVSMPMPCTAMTIPSEMRTPSANPAHQTLLFSHCLK